ncbi:protein C1orf43 homolog isoform X3 [Myotis myotis]|uniref:protein C1orf43 homolog isoform X3 n=1 Tax=Myotis myotis TaxID=51298 RepID=UPI00174D198D|nr:protein C1orf43 homolog isoform X3 [Myotis myotis]
MASSSNWLSGVNVVLVMAYGSLVFVLLFIFVKRQIMRFAMKSRRGPHVPVGHNAPKDLKEDPIDICETGSKDLKEEIDIRLSRVQDIKYEPQLLADDDARLLQLDTQANQSCYNYLYRMKALDAIRASEIPFHAEGRHPRSLMGKNFRSYLLDLRNTSTPFKGVRKALIDTLLDGYETARYGTGVFGQREYLRYQEALSELATVVKARSGNSQRQHQSAAKDLTQSPEVSPTTIQVAKCTHSLSVADDIEPEEKPLYYSEDSGCHGTGAGTGQQATIDGPSSRPAPAV